MRGADATEEGESPGLTVAAGARVGPQAATRTLKQRTRAARMSQLVWSRLQIRAPRWRNRQTRRSQKPMSARTFGFDSRSRHLASPPCGEVGSGRRPRTRGAAGAAVGGQPPPVDQPPGIEDT